MKKKDVLIRGFSEIATGPQDYGRGVVRITVGFARELGINSRHDLLEMQKSGGGGKLWAVVRMTERVGDDEIALEYDQRVALGVEKGKRWEVIFKKRGIFAWWGFFWHHPDVSFRLMTRMSVVVAGTSLVVGFALSEMIG